MLVWRIASIVSAPTPYFGDKPIARITAFDMQRYIKQRRDHVTDATINRELSTLSHLLHRALEWQWIDKVIKVPHLRENGRHTVYLTPEQIQRLLDAARLDSCWDIHPFIQIGLHTAMRRMEILSIRWEHVDLSRLLIHIPHAKAGSRNQPITTALAATLTEWRALIQTK